VDEEAMPFEIAPMLPEEYPEVRTLWESTSGVGLDASDAEPGIVAYLERNPGLCLVARGGAAGGHAIIGAVLCGHDGRRGYLSHLTVAAEHRGQGIARQLIERCLDQLRESGILKCSIHVFSDNDEGIAFWKQLGYHVRGDVTVMQRAVEL
jgi:N-acetylglutamate synthase